MKFFLAFALIAVASAATFNKPTALTGDLAEIQQVIDAINHPSTDPATAVLLEQMLLETLGVAQPEPIAVGPAIVDAVQPISVGPAIVDFPIPDGGAVSAEVAPVAPAVVVPVAVDTVATPEAAVSPLVQLIINIAAPAGAAVPPVAVATPETVVDQPHPVQVVDSAVNPIPEPVVLPPAPAPVTVVETAPEPVQVVDFVPEPVLVASPVLPVAPVAVLPEILN